MTPKRVAVFLLLVIGSPFWLALRSHFGERFLLLLGAAWGIAFAATWLVAQGHLPAAPPEIVRTAWALQKLLEMTVWIWAGQAAMQVMHWTAVALRETERRHPWYVGAFWFRGISGGFMDLIAAAVFGGWMCIMTTGLPSATQAMAQYAIGGMAGSFVLLALICHAKGQILPVKPPLPRAGCKLPVRYISRLKVRARPSREGLAQIFSRRDPALRELTKS